MDRLFLDANVLFSAAYRPKAGLARLWKLKRAELVTSVYAVEEARINLLEQAQRSRLRKLLRAVLVIRATLSGPLPPGVDLPEKDRPILLAAVAARASHLLTGDKEHFGRYFGTTIAGVTVLPPAEHLQGRKRTGQRSSGRSRGLF